MLRNMKGCLWYRRRKNRKGIAVNDPNLKRDNDDDGMKNEDWFDSKVMFDSDSDDDFKSVNGDSLPSSFGYSNMSQGGPRPSFISLKERMEELVQEKESKEAFSHSDGDQNVSSEKVTLGQLFITKPENDKDLEGEKKQSEVQRQGSKKGYSSGEGSHKSCFSGILPSIGSEKKVPRSPEAHQEKTAQFWLPHRLCAS